MLYYLMFVSLFNLQYLFFRDCLVVNRSQVFQTNYCWSILPF